MNWFYESGGQQQGPVQEHELDRLLAEGRITPETLIWREGLPDWQPLRIARPTAAVPPNLPPGTAPGEIPPGYVRCSLTGKIIPESEAIYIQGKPYSAEAKPQVLHSIQSGEALPTADDLNRTGPAWERRQELGLVTAAWETVRSVLMEPSATFSNMKREGGIGSPLVYYILLGTLGSAFLYLCLFAAALAGAIPQGVEGVPQQQMTAVQLFLNILFAPVQVAIYAFIQAGIVHVSLMIVRGAKRPFETTFRSICYVGGSVYALMCIPVCGWVAAVIWGLVLPCIALARTHEIGTGRATLGFYLPWIICCGLLLIIGVIGGVMGALGTGAAPQ